MVRIKCNTIVKNSLNSNAAGIWVENNSAEIIYNTIIGNARGIELNFLRDRSPTIKYNTIFGNNKYSPGYDILCCDSCSPKVYTLPPDATLNYWGQNTTIEMETKGCNANIQAIYDWYDDFYLGKVNYCNWLLYPDEDAPVSPPTGLSATAYKGAIALTWSVNPESDLAGYKVYWDTVPGNNYTNVVNAGNVTAYTITGLSDNTYYVTVTAYDKNYNPIYDESHTFLNGNQFNGNESWFAEEQTISIKGAPPIAYTVTVSKLGAGTGTVTSNPGGINCGNDCSESYDQGTGVILSATAASDSTFGGWSGEGCSGTGSCSVIMDGNKSIIATFNQKPQYTLTVTKPGAGSGTVTSSPEGINCGDDCSETYTEGQKVKLTAKANPNSTFAGWSGGGCSGTKTCMVTMDAAITVTADFALKTPDISVAQTSIEFDSVKVGKKATKTLKILNNGTGDLDDNAFRVRGDTFWHSREQ